LKYFERRRKAKLYRQWVERAGLPHEATYLETQKAKDARPQIYSPESARSVPESPPTIYLRTENQIATHPDVTGNMLAEINKRRTNLPLLYLLLGICVVVFIAVLTLFVLWSC
jgi:hypothetical protein